MAAEQVTYNAPDGAQVGKSSTELLGFYGATPIVPPTLTATISTTASISTAGSYGFSTSTETLQIVAAVSTLALALRNLGLVI